MAGDFAGGLLVPEDPRTGVLDYSRAFEFDVLEEASGAREAVVPKHPREADGGEASDARLRRPATARFSGLLGERSAGYEPDVPGRAESRLADLLELEESGSLLTVVAPAIRPLRSMTIRQVSWQALPDEEAIQVQLTFEPVRIARLAVRPALLDADLRALGGSGRVDVGAW